MTFAERLASAFVGLLVAALVSGCSCFHEKVCLHGSVEDGTGHCVPRDGGAHDAAHDAPIGVDGRPDATNDGALDAGDSGNDATTADAGDAGSCAMCGWACDMDLCVAAAGVTAGGDHSCAWLATGGAACWGANLFGELGNGGGPDSPVPVTVLGVDGLGILARVREMTSGELFSCARFETATAACWGRNINGQLGDGTMTDRSAPVGVARVGGGGPLTRVEEIASGTFHTCARITGGTVVCWGRNLAGQLGDGTTTSRTTPVEVRAVGGAGSLGSVTQISAGGSHSCALTSMAQVVCWGSGGAGQLGNGASTSSPTPVAVSGVGGAGMLSDVAEIAASEAHTCARLRSGEVVCWGRNAEGQLGDDSTTNSSTPIFVHGLGGTGRLDRAVQLGDGFGDMTCARLDDGTVACWGANRFGQIGIGSMMDSPVPALVSSPTGADPLGDVRHLAEGFGHVCAVRSPGDVLCWGLNATGELGDGTEVSRDRPVSVVAPSP